MIFWIERIYKCMSAVQLVTIVYQRTRRQLVTCARSTNTVSAGLEAASRHRSHSFITAPARRSFPEPRAPLTSPSSARKKTTAYVYDDCRYCVRDRFSHESRLNGFPSVSLNTWNNYALNVYATGTPTTCHPCSRIQQNIWRPGLVKKLSRHILLYWTTLFHCFSTFFKHNNV